MTLPSQSARSSNTAARTFTRSRRRRRGKSRRPLLLLIVVVAVLAAGTWVLLGPGFSLLGGAVDDADSQDVSTNTDTPPPRDALSRPMAGRTLGTRGIAPPTPSNPTTTDQPAVAERRTDPVSPTNGSDEPTGTGSRNLSEARRDRNSDSAPSPLAAALDAQSQQPERRSPAQAEPAPRTQPRPRASDDNAVVQAMRAADAEVQRDRPSAARQILDGVVHSAGPSAAAANARAALSALNATLLFGPTIFEGEPLTHGYVVEPGDSLSRIASREKLGVDWRLIQRINRISDPSKIRVGQTIKLVKGPFHAVVHKSEFRIDLFAGPAANRAAWRFVLSAGVGLGEGDSTPTGSFAVRPESRLINPHWVNPRTGERFDAENKMNPIGERWIGLEGLGADAIKTGYGIHGTIEPDSIGEQRSMGCIRMGEQDVSLVYELLMPGSLVFIEP